MSKYSRSIVGRISAQFLHDRAFCDHEKSTIFTECVDFYTSMNISGAICEISAES